MKKLRFSLLLLFTLSMYLNVLCNGKDTNEITAKNTSTISFLFIPADQKNLSLYQELGKNTPITGNVDQLKSFFNLLKDSNNKKIRVIHYGDSQIQGDVISEYIREKLQSKYGGRGAGYLSIQSNDIRMRRTTEQSFSDDWNFASVVTRNPEGLPFGISGSVAIPKPGSWVKYKTTNNLKSSSSFEFAKLYYSNADESSIIQYSVNNGKPFRINLEKSKEVKELVINTATNSTLIEIKFISGKQPYFYGVSLESGNGVYVDNFPMPGNTGASLLEIPLDVLKDFNEFSNYGLIILSYGNNVSSSNRGIYTVYENKMLSVIDHLRKAFPQAGILMFSVNDKTVKQGNRFVTNPDVPLIMETQKRIVNKAKVGFWNLWEAMGGTNSMNDWVNAAPPMALKDFAHFTPIGGERVAELFINALLEAESTIKKK